MSKQEVELEFAKLLKEYLESGSYMAGTGELEYFLKWLEVKTEQETNHDKEQ